jgi:hypothetical protein
LQIYIQDEQTAELRLRVPSTASSPILDPILSPDGCSIAYVRDDEIFVIPSTDGQEVQITSGARETEGKVSRTAVMLNWVDFACNALCQLYSFLQFSLKSFTNVVLMSKRRRKRKP